MDKYEFNIKVEQIKKLVGKSDYGTAMKIADTIDWRRVRNTNLLSMVATIYEKNEDYEEAKEILLLAYERAPIGKRLLYKLAELALKQGSIAEAEDYYKEFSDLASDDPRQQLLRYMILKAKGAPAQQLIHSLESYTSVELDEKWLYELAELYSLAGMPDRCVETCDKIMLMFGLGKYVDKAMDLKIQYAPLTNYQLDLVENRDKYEAKLREVEQQYNLGKNKSLEQEYYQEDPMYQQEFQEGQAYDNGQGYDNSKNFVPDQGYSEGNYDHEQSYVSEQGYEPDQNMYQNHNKGSSFALQQDYRPSQDYDQGAGYMPGQDYGQAENYGEDQGYMPDQDYGQAEGYGENQGYIAGQDYGQAKGYGENQGYIAGQGYEPGTGSLNNQDFVENQAYGQAASEISSREYEAGQAYGAQLVTSRNLVKAQETGNIQNFNSVQSQGVDQDYDVNHNYSNEQVYEPDSDYGENQEQNGDHPYNFVGDLSVDSDYSAQDQYAGNREYSAQLNYTHNEAYGNEAEYTQDQEYSFGPYYAEESGNGLNNYRKNQDSESDLDEGEVHDYETEQPYVTGLSYERNQIYEPNTGLTGGEEDPGSEFGTDEAYGFGQPANDRILGEEHEDMSEGNYPSDRLMEQELSPAQNDAKIQLKEAEVQEKLAREMSRISREEPVLQEESKMDHTRVLDDIRRVGRPITAIPRPRGVFMPVEDDISSGYSEPVIEEDIVDGPGMEEDGDEYGKDLTENGCPDGYARPELVYQQSAITLEDQEKPVQQSDIKEPIAFKHQPVKIKAFEKDDLEFEDLNEDEKEMPRVNHLMIEARTPEKGMQMAVEALKQIHQESGLRNPVAKISGEKLARRGVLACAEKLAGKDLVIEEAGDLTAQAIVELNQLMDQDVSGMIVVLIDNPKQMEMLHRDYPDLASKFECIGLNETKPEPESVKTVTAYEENNSKPVKTAKPQMVKTLNYRAEEPEPAGCFRNRPSSEPVYEEERPVEPVYKTGSWMPDDYKEEDYFEETYDENSDYEEDDFYEEGESEEHPSVRDEEGPGFHGEEMDIDEFAQYACRYANEIDCSITGKSMLALYERIEIMEEDGSPLTRAHAEDLIEAAADRAERPSFGKRIKGLFSSKYDKDGLLILKEEHFIY